LQVLVTFGVGYVVFGVTVEGSVIGFVLLAVAACGLAAATGLLVAALGGTEPRARSVSVLVILGVSMLGGLWVPAFVLPAWVRNVSYALPTTWAMRGLETVTWQGGGFFAALPSAAAVAGFALALLALAAVRLKLAERAVRAGRM
jgi:ABC-2 type transport system permease protein